jgi:hypothetical protein
VREAEGHGGDAKLRCGRAGRWQTRGEILGPYWVGVRSQEVKRNQKWEGTVERRQEDV